MSARAVEMKAQTLDVESNGGLEKADTHLLNDSVHTFSWESIVVKVPDRDTKAEKSILSDICGNVKAGEDECCIQFQVTALTPNCQANW